MDNKDIFASNLKKQMQLHGKSRKDISEALGVSYFTVSDWVAGKKYPRMDKVEMLANYFGILKSELIEESTEILSRSERIKFLVEKSGLSYQELEKKTGIKKSSLQRYATGVTTKIPLDVIEKLAKAFNVSQAYLMGWEDEPSTPTGDPKLSEGERELLGLFREVPKEHQRSVIEIVRVHVNSISTARMRDHEGK